MYCHTIPLLIIQSIRKQKVIIWQTQEVLPLYNSSLSNPWLDMKSFFSLVSEKSVTNRQKVWLQYSPIYIWGIILYILTFGILLGNPCRTTLSIKHRCSNCTQLFNNVDTFALNNSQDSILKYNYHSSKFIIQVIQSMSFNSAK